MVNSKHQMTLLPARQVTKGTPMKNTSLTLSFVSLLFAAPVISGCLMESADEAERMAELESHFSLDADDIAFEYVEGRGQITVYVEVDERAAELAGEGLYMNAQWSLPDGTRKQSSARLATTKTAGPAFRYILPMVGEGTYEFVVEEVEGDGGVVLAGSDVTGTMTIVGSNVNFLNSLPGADCPESFLVGGVGNDILPGTMGKSDTIQGKHGNDTITGHDCTDFLHGNAGADDLFGNGGADVLYGGGGNDKLVGGLDVDWCYGGSGVDTFSKCEIIIAD